MIMGWTAPEGEQIRRRPEWRAIDHRGIMGRGRPASLGAHRRIEAVAPSASAWISAARNCEVSPRVVCTRAA